MEVWKAFFLDQFQTKIFILFTLHLKQLHIPLTFKSSQLTPKCILLPDLTLLTASKSKYSATIYLDYYTYATCQFRKTPWICSQITVQAKTRLFEKKNRQLLMQYTSLLLVIDVIQMKAISICHRCRCRNCQNDIEDCLRDFNFWFGIYFSFSDTY